jgi:hypothetical protein
LEKVQEELNQRPPNYQQGRVSLGPASFAGQIKPVENLQAPFHITDPPEIAGLKCLCFPGKCGGPILESWMNVPVSMRAVHQVEKSL